MPMISIRVDDGVAALFDERAAECGLPSRSAWCREVLMAAAAPSNGQQAHPRRALALQRNRIAEEVNPGDCKHPPQAHVDMPFSVICKCCGEVVRHR